MKIIYKPAFWIIFFIAINAIIVLVSPLLPFIDLPNHLAEATIYKYYGQADNVFSTYYSLTPWYFPNTFYLLFTSSFPSVEFGDRIYFILYLSLLSFSTYLIIKELKGNLWYGLFSFLLIFNYNVSYGFSGFYMAIPVTLLLFYVLLLEAKRGKLVYKLYAGLLLVLLFFMHAQMALFGLLIFGGMNLCIYWNKPLKLFAFSLFSLPVLFLICLWWYSRNLETAESTTVEFLLAYYKRGYLSQFYRRAIVLVMDHYQLYKGIGGMLIGLLFSFYIIFPLLRFRVWEKAKWKKFFVRNTIYPLIFFLIASACFFLLPFGLPGQLPLYQRFCTIVVLSVVVLGSVILPNIEVRWFRMYVLSAVVIYSLVWSEYIYTFNRQNAAFNKKFFSTINNSNRMAALIYDLEYRGRKIYSHYPNYFIVWNKGISTTSIIDFRFGVIKRNISRDTLPRYRSLVGDKYEEIREYKDLEYILVRGEAPGQFDTNLDGFSLWREKLSWRLFKHDKVVLGNTKLQ